MPLPTIQFRYRPAKNKLQDVVFGEIFCLFLWYVLLFKRSGFYDWSDYALWAVAIGGTATLSICLFNYCRGGRIITLMDKAIIIPASYYLSFQRRFTVDYGDIARITEQYCERHGTPGIFITAHGCRKALSYGKNLYYQLQRLRRYAAIPESCCRAAKAR